MKLATILATSVATFFLTSVIAAGPIKAEVPGYVVDPFWPKDLPEGWTLGQVSGIAVDGQDNIWVVHRPRTMDDDEKGAQKTPPETRCCQPAPAVMQFAPDGRLLKSWGGTGGAGYGWPKNEHGIHVDREGNVWIGGNDKDDQILKFTPDGKFLLQIGKADTAGGSNSMTRLGRPAHMVVIGTPRCRPSGYEQSGSREAASLRAHRRSTLEAAPRRISKARLLRKASTIFTATATSWECSRR
jgi:hypothetical protein